MNTDITKANAEWLASGCVECAKKHIDPGLLVAIETAVIMKCADAVSGNYGWINGVYYDDLAEGLLTLIPQDGHTALEELGMKVADKVYGHFGVDPDREQLRSIVTNLIGDAK